MRLVTNHAMNAGGLACPEYSLGIVGPVLDDRGAAAVEHASACCTRVIELSYGASNKSITSNGREVPWHRVQDVLGAPIGKHVLVESTTLGLAEVVLCCRHFVRAADVLVDFLYVEPSEYTKGTGDHEPGRRDFELTDEVKPFGAVPGFAMALDPGRSQRTVFLLGYEGQRLGIALEQLGVPRESIFVTFGVPAFRSGWEMNAFENNLPMLREHRLAGRIHYEAADNPDALRESLARIHAAGAEELLVIPIGTKPHGIGAAVYAATTDRVGMTYDFPQRKSRRSVGVGTWHLYQLR